MEEILTKQKEPPAWQSFIFSFFSVYFFLYIFPFPAGYNGNFSSISSVYYKGFNTLVFRLNNIFFHNPVMNPVDTGSGDRAFNYVQSFTMAVLALIITALWYLFTKRRNTSRILYWLYVYTQVYLSVTIVRYGLIKVVRAQFPFPYDGLMKTYSETSPMLLMTSFMGSSATYSVFTGVIEVLAGLLILYRKTSLVGAILAIGAMANVVMINIGYDVPVKLHAFHLLLMAVYITIPFAERLGSLFISGTSTRYIYYPGFISGGRKSPFIRGAIILAVAMLLYSDWQYTRYKYSAYGKDTLTSTPLFGFYRVQNFIRNKDTLLPLITDTSQWKMLSVAYKRRAAIKMMNDSTKLCLFVADTSKQTITLTDQEDASYQASFIYRQPDTAHLVLSGKLNNDSVIIILEKQDPEKFRLVNHQFRWIHENLDYK